VPFLVRQKEKTKTLHSNRSSLSFSVPFLMVRQKRMQYHNGTTLFCYEFGLEHISDVVTQPLISINIVMIFKG